MAVNVQFTLANFQEGYCWPGAQQYATDLVALLAGTVPDLNGVVISYTQPDAADQDKMWIKTDINGFPLGHFVFLGQWLWPHPKEPGGNERMIWVGSLNDLGDYDGGDHTAGVTDTTGPFWERDTNFGDESGSNPFRFPVGAGKNSVAYDGGSETTIAIGDTGGDERITLADQEISHDTFVAGDDVESTNNPALHVDATHAVAREHSVGLGADYRLKNSTLSATVGKASPVGNTVDPRTSHQNLPPYYGVIFAKRTGRIYMTP